MAESVCFINNILFDTSNKICKGNDNVHGNGQTFQYSLLDLSSHIMDNRDVTRRPDGSAIDIKRVGKHLV